MKYRYREPHEMKDSGIEWLGQIPKEWGFKKIKRMSRIGRGASPRPIDDPMYFDENGEYAWTRIADVSSSGKYLEKTTQKMSDLGANLSVKLNPGELFLSIAGSVGKPCIPAIKTCIHDGFVYFPDLNNLEIEFLYHLFSNGQCYLGLGKLGTQLNLNRETVGNISITLPTSDEELKKLVNFVDQKTAEFDSVIEKKGKLIERLEEAKKSLISEVVAGKKRVYRDESGELRVENRPAHEMKDSGVKGRGKIPVEWIENKLRNICYMKGRIGWQGLKQSEFIDEGPYLITGMNFKNGIINWNECYHISEARYLQAPEIMLQLNDVLMTKDGTIGKLLYVDTLPDKASLNSHLLVMRSLNNEFNQKYLYYQLGSEPFKKHIEYYKTGTTFYGITQESVGKYRMLLPSIKEQLDIIEFLDAEDKLFRKLIDKNQKIIEKLRAAKQSLISEAVTGKIEIL